MLHEHLSLLHLTCYGLRRALYQLNEPIMQQKDNRMLRQKNAEIKHFQVKIGYTRLTK